MRLSPSHPPTNTPTHPPHTPWIHSSLSPRRLVAASHARLAPAPPRLSTALSGWSRVDADADATQD